MAEVFALAVGLANNNASGQVLDCLFPRPWLNPKQAILEAALEVDPGVSTMDPQTAQRLNDQTNGQLFPQVLIESDKPLTVVRLDEEGPIESTAAAYLKLHLLSHRLSLPNTLNLDGMFEHLPNLAWTNAGPIEVDALQDALVRARTKGEHLEVMAVDKFPKMVNYVVPTGVRIADASRIRLGAFLGEGTTVMHEGFVNFNAGALGPNMVEGRISQGVILHEGTDLGGSASTMGTLSGGGEIIISIGKNCLVGANAGTGIPLGDRCTIEAGLYITAGTVVSVVDEAGEEVRKAKARELAGNSDMLFIRNSQTGQVMCRTNRRAIELNDALHAHN
jgi:2,3,4,5-tetrahydropyridine-2-carboxylate N-succinyltransferase